MYVAVAAIGGAAVSAWSANKSAGAVSGGTKRAAAYSLIGAQQQRKFEKRQLAYQRKATKPWLKTGREAIFNLREGMRPGGRFTEEFGAEDYQADPGYEFRLTEGIKARDRSAASRGQLLSGSQLKGLERYSQGVASDEYQRAYNRFNLDQERQYNRLAGLAQVGQQTSQYLGQAGAQSAGRMGDISQQQSAAMSNAALMGGQAQASAYQGYGQAAGQALGAAGQFAQQKWG